MTIISNMSNAGYHSHAAVSKTQLDQLAKSPAHYKHARESETESTQVMIFGSAFHDYILLPEVFAESYAVLPDDFNGRTKDGKAQLAEIAESGKTILKAEWVEQIKGMAAAIQAHPKAAALLSSGKPEQSVFWRDEETGIDCRCRPDFWNRSGIIVDLKSTEDASPQGFARSVANYRYHVQDAFYSNGIYQATGEYPKGFIFIAVEKKAPFAVACYTLDEQAKERGHELFRRDLMTLAECIKTNTFQAYSEQIEPLSLPAWAYYDKD